MGIDLYIENLMPKLTQKTCQLIQNREAKLHSIQWHIGESNVDKEFSEFAKICCEDAFSECINQIVQKSKKYNFDKIAAIESRGFVFASAVSYILKKPFIMLRKKK